MHVFVMLKRNRLILRQTRSKKLASHFRRPGSCHGGVQVLLGLYRKKEQRCFFRVDRGNYHRTDMFHLISCNLRNVPPSGIPHSTEM